MAKKILIVEDDQFLGEILNKKLDNSGYAVKWVTDGQTGLEEIKNYRPDLVLLDIILPRMNGYEVLEAVNKDPEIAHTPIVIISNSGQPVEITRALALGVKDYLVKAQFDPEEVLAKVKSQLEGTNHSEKGSKPGLKVLVVEDDKFLSGLVVKKLQQEKWNVFLAGDGEQALQLVKQEKPDIVLLDIVLPGIDGFEVLSRVKADPEVKDIPIVLLSNLGQESDVKRGHELGAVDFMTKANFTLDEIVDKIYAVTAGAAGGKDGALGSDPQTAPAQAPEAPAA